jgi:hypothetical protein
MKRNALREKAIRWQYTVVRKLIAIIRAVWLRQAPYKKVLEEVI